MPEITQDFSIIDRDDDSQDLDRFLLRFCFERVLASASTNDDLGETERLDLYRIWPASGFGMAIAARLPRWAESIGDAWWQRNHDRLLAEYKEAERVAQPIPETLSGHTAGGS